MPLNHPPPKPQIKNGVNNVEKNVMRKRKGNDDNVDVDIIPEHYTELKKVGEGTYAQSVFKAFEERMNRWVAVKVLKECDVQLKYVEEEVRILQVLRKETNVVSLYESYKVGDRMLLVFEYMDFDLFALMTVRATNSFSEEEYKYIMIQILHGLQQLANNGIMHRDIKSANILVNKEGHVKIGDLGTATRTDRDKFHSSVCTLWYRPPELLLGSTNYGYEIDIWAAACVFVELLSGGCYFLRGDSELDQLTKIYNFFGSFPKDPFYDGLKRKTMLDEIDTTKKNSQLPYYLHRYVNEKGVDLLTHMFDYMPKKRYSATECVAHEYFITSPLPATSLRLAEVSEIHGFEAMKQEKMRDKKPTTTTTTNGNGNYYPPPPAKRRADDSFGEAQFKRGRSRFQKRRRHNFQQDSDILKEGKPTKITNKVLPFFQNIEIAPELNKFDEGIRTSDFLDPNRLVDLGIVKLPHLISPSLEENLFF
jgi:CTD kinase subunit alpha